MSKVRKKEKRIERQRERETDREREREINIAIDLLHIIGSKIILFCSCC